ncbi:hypothetical protein D0T50_00075 [Bacteroides sp. 214]|uniref:hypothetical protein n=1 Tax=Bacteroides sp. 214 TaxID=2302935 RepID=UPI0013D49EA5|nr:hypothetical protein [Bacteroides sp. 214]NDW11286.1 hypothetical protein [Bacteroides sp. 214]
MRNITTGIIAFFFIISIQLYGQTPVNRYFEKVKSNAAIYTGEQESQYNFAFYDNHPYHKTSDFSTGEVYTNNNYYSNIELRLDLYKNNLCAKTPNGHIVIIEKDHVKEFSFNHSYFLHIPITNNWNLASGYYNRLYKGNELTLLLREECILNRPNDKVTSYFSFKKKYFLIMEGKAYPINKKSNIYKLFPSHKKEIKKYAKERALRWREHRDQYLTEVFALCEKLTYQTGKR